MRARNMDGSLWLPFKLSFSRSFLAAGREGVEADLKLFFPAVRDVLPRSRMPTLVTVSMPSELSYTKCRAIPRWNRRCPD